VTRPELGWLLIGLGVGYALWINHHPEIKR